MSNTGENLESENAQQWQINQITGDPRKFSEYVLVPRHQSGADYCDHQSRKVRIADKSDRLQLMCDRVKMIESNTQPTELLLTQHSCTDA
ncbi:MAG: hypothetical protein V7K40_14505 [Nostoc sp.]|uniref:hypothetical protein n=1 Tax=Nostoc sp. TaxID=1180 RepID=UPI002FFC7AFD